MPKRRARRATSPPIRPTPTITTVRPAIGVMKIGSHRRSRWRVTKWGTPWFSMRRAVIAYSPPFGMCTPLALVRTTSGGRSGTSFSTPALVDWIHRRCGARAREVPAVDVGDDQDLRLAQPLLEGRRVDAEGDPEPPSELRDAARAAARTAAA